MKVISGGRGVGKTKMLIELAAQNDGIIVCDDTTKMLEKIHGYGFSNIKVITYDEFILCDKTAEKYYVRNAEQLFGKLNIDCLTITTGEE